MENILKGEDKVSIQERIQEDLKTAIKNRDPIREDLKIIMSELQRQKTKILSDDSVVEILRRLAGWERDRLKTVELSRSDYLDTINKYIPEQLSEEEIEKWINENIDLTKLKNKFSAIRVILSHFGTATSGSQIRNILNNM